MKLNKITIEEFESVIAFYDDVAERTPDMDRYARWQKGKHPTAEGIRVYIEEGSMYVYKEDDAIVGAMVSNICMQRILAGLTSISLNMENKHLNVTICHKMMQNIPDIWQY